MSPIAQKREEQLQKAEILAIELARANTHLHFFRELQKTYRLPVVIKDFWDYTLTAHFGTALLQICRVYDTHKRGVNLLGVLAGVDVKGLNPKEQRRLNEYISHCREPSNHTVVGKYRAWPNNIIAHLNLRIATSGREQFIRKHSLELAEVQQVIDLGFEMLEWFAQIHGRNIKYQRFPEGKDGHEYLLDRIWEKPVR